MDKSLPCCAHQTIINNYCNQCSGLIINEFRSVKPEKQRFKLEIDPTHIIQQLKLNNSVAEPNLVTLTKPSTERIIINYLKKRKRLMKAVKAFIDRYKFKDKSYYHAINLMDTVVSRCEGERFLFTENIAIGCLVLSGKYLF